MEPTADERERVMGFPTGVTVAPSVSEASRRQVLGQAMDLNCLTWIVSLGMAEQRRLRALAGTTPHSTCSLPPETVQASAGGERGSACHPWCAWGTLEERVEEAAHGHGGVDCLADVSGSSMEESRAASELAV